MDQKSTNTTVTESSPTKRGRGRPRKVAAAAPAPASIIDAPTKRGRGRPRKSLDDRRGSWLGVSCTRAEHLGFAARALEDRISVSALIRRLLGFDTPG